jgi:superfamily II DNA or RNA helicase
VFVAAQPNGGFGTFVQQARGDPQQRPGLFAWHRALQLASWNRNKADAVAELLARHRNERVLVFTPDRRSTYELARTHLIAPVTAELPRRERQATLAAFAAGRLRTLAGPRLLDLGVPEGCADVGILVGGGYGRDQHDARCRRVAATGVVFELIALDTVEVGRAHRFGRSIAAATAVGHAGGW